jgi:D-glycerate 3-kinase
MGSSAWIDAFLARESLPESYRDVIREQLVPLGDQLGATARERAATASGPLLVGVCGAQGSGKSTLVAALGAQLQADGVRAAALSLDDLYLTRAERQVLARDVHPLLATRGVPGTHDVELGRAVFARLARHGATALPSFDKAVDDRRAPADWPSVEGPLQVILFEGWCVGAVPQDAAALASPINALERDEDPAGVWRGYVNAALAQRYRALFDAIDTLVLLRAPSFEVVFEWRREQERKLAQRIAATGARATAVMDATQLARFIAHYERLTRHILEEMPARAAVLFELDAQRRMTRRR